MSFSFITKTPPKQCRAFDAFKNGLYERSKIKRHYQAKYDRYHYWLPASMMPTIHFLRDYFRFLDALCNTPEEHRYRKTEYEYAETAISIMHIIRNRISISDPIVIGSASINPIPWAIFGPSMGTQNKIFRNRFITPHQIFDYYDGKIWRTKGFNSIAIERPLHMDPDRDPLMTLVGIYDRSANYILATALLLATDIIRFGGPDCGELRHLFTNDKRPHSDDFSAWIRTRNAIIEPRNFDIGELWVKAGVRHSNTSTSQKFCYLSDRGCYPEHRRQSDYWEVEVRDVFSASHVDLLTHGENIEYYRELYPEKPQLLLPAPDNYKNLSKSDLSDDDDKEIEIMERQFDEMLESRENRLCLSDWVDMARGFTDELYES